MAERPGARRRRILVTGGAGFIGSNFVRMALARWPGAHVARARRADLRGQPRRTSRTSPTPRARRSCTATSAIPKAVAQAMEGVTHVVNFAAESHGRPLDRRPGLVRPDRRLRRVRPARGGEAAAASSASSRSRPTRSTARCSRAHATEESPLLPRNPYAASKAGGDRLAYAYYATYGLPVVITRCSNNYGPYQYPEKLIPLFVTNAIDDEPLPVYGTGKNLRDWIHVDDHCDGDRHAARGRRASRARRSTSARGNELDVLTITEHDPRAARQARRR